MLPVCVWGIEVRKTEGEGEGKAERRAQHMRELVG